MAEREVRDLIRPQEPKRVKIEDIQRVVARQYNVSRSDLLSSRRTANVVRPRQVAMYLAKTLTLRSLPEIGRRFGGRDHTTVLHAVRKIEALVGKDVGALRRGRIAEAPAAGVSLRSAAASSRPGDAAPSCEHDRGRPANAWAKRGTPRPLRLRAIRATLRSPRGLDRIQLDQAFGSQMPRRAFGPPGFSISGSGGYCNEGHRRTRATPEIAGPRPSRGRAPQHHSDPRQRAGPRRKRAAVA